MMEGLNSWVLRLVKVSIICQLLIIRSASASEGNFVSLACCADLNYTDPKTLLNYTSDSNWFSDRRNCRKVTKSDKVNNFDYDKARVFEINYGKRCYRLPTVKDGQYLVRGTFLFDDSLRASSVSSFEISIAVTLLSIVNPFQDSEIEGVFKANKNYTDFCLLRKHGNPCISLLELRPLQNLEYLEGFPSGVLKLIDRYNLGGKRNDTIRYPSDPSDRIWKSYVSPLFDTISSTVNTTYQYNASVTPPLEVLHTALTHQERLEFSHRGLETGEYEYRVILYFLELNETVQIGQRVFVIHINGVIKRSRFDILDGGSNYQHLALNVTANGSLNLTFVKANGSVFGPICSAYEILQVRPWMEETNPTDLEVIFKVRDELLVHNKDNRLLDSWYGDPCHIIPWKGVVCDHRSTPPIITKLDLASSELKGPLPPSVTVLSNIRVLNLSRNSFNGNIPSFPTSSLLSSVDLSYNDFAGLLPNSLTSLTQLKSIYFGCNPRMSKEVPSNFKKSLDTDNGRCMSKGSRRSEEIVIGTVTCGSLFLTLAVGILFVCRYRDKLRRPWGSYDDKTLPFTSNLIFSFTSKDDFIMKPPVSVQTFSLEYIEAATENYKTLIGEGGFGSVYRGTLPNSQEVAVKVRSSTSTQGTREFENELNLLTAIRHENLVPLLGFCCEKDQQILVYPFMSNGSLQDRLYGEPAKRKVLDWPTRLSVALGAARGLAHLHTLGGRCVIHRDVKSSNILLDHSMCAKVADFGFSKYAPQEGDSGASLELRGTAGYLDPEYYTTQQLSAKSDVFSFGVVLLEIVSGREPLNLHRPRNEWSLVEWAKSYLQGSKIDEIVDPGIKGGYHAEAMWRVAEVAVACIQPFSANRPSMDDVVRELEDALIIENNASEYMKSIDSLGGSSRFSIVLDKKTLPPPPPMVDPSPISTQNMSPPQPR